VVKFYIRTGNHTKGQLLLQDIEETQAILDGLSHLRQDSQANDEKKKTKKNKKNKNDNKKKDEEMPNQTEECPICFEDLGGGTAKHTGTKMPPFPHTKQVCCTHQRPFAVIPNVVQSSMLACLSPSRPCQDPWPACLSDYTTLFPKSPIGI
jgi:hypothetical protein